MNLWKAVNARIYRCRVAFLHFLTKTHQNMANRIREAHSLRSVSIADGLSVPAGHLTHSALVHSGALTPLRRFAALFRPLRTPCSGVLSSCADGFPAAQAHGTVYGMPLTMGTERDLDPFPHFFHKPFI